MVEGTGDKGAQKKKRRGWLTGRGLGRAGLPAREASASWIADAPTPTPAIDRVEDPRSSPNPPITI